MANDNAGTQRFAILDGSSLSSTDKIFTFPNQTGTFALTNNPTPLTATSFIKSSTPATNILLAGGGDIAQNTAFNKNFGTTAGTVVEGNDSRINNGQTAFGWGNHVNGGYAITTGSNINQASFRTALGLGSNAYNSTAYLPLSGGDLSGQLKIVIPLSALAETVRFINTDSGDSSGIGGGIGGISNSGLSFFINGVSKMYLDGLGKLVVSSSVAAASYTATSLPVFENNAAASSLAVGQFYRTSIGVLMVKF